jgi:hypothetical protein
MSIGAGALAHQLAALRVKTLRASMRTRRMLVDILPGYFERLLFGDALRLEGCSHRAQPLGSAARTANRGIDDGIDVPPVRGDDRHAPSRYVDAVALVVGSHHRVTASAHCRARTTGVGTMASHHPIQCQPGRLGLVTSRIVGRTR